jgi:PST family polysaccharide transporter
MAWTARGRPLYPVLRDLSLKAVSLGLERGSRLIVIVASAPALGEAAFGVFVYTSTVTAILALAADLGLGVWTTRALARGDGDGAKVVAAGLGLRALAMVPYAVAITILALLTAEGEARSAMVLLGVAAAFNAFSDHFGAIFRGSGRFPVEARLNATRAVLTAGGGVLALALHPSLVALCVAFAAASVGAFFFGLHGVHRAHPPPPFAARERVDRTLARTALRESWPIWLAGLLSLLYFKVDTFFVRSFTGDAELGAYGAAYKLFEGAMLLPAVVLAATFPRLARLRDDPPAQRRLERRLGATLLAIGVVVGATFYLTRTPLIGALFGASFHRAEDSLRVLALGIPLVYLNFGLTHFLIARDKERVNLWLSLMMLGVTVLLDVLLIPGRSGPGAALATVLAEVALTVCCLGALTGVPPARRGRPLRGTGSSPGNPHLR